VLFSSRAELLCEAFPAERVRLSASALVERMDRSPIRFQGTFLGPALDSALSAVASLRQLRDDVIPRIYVLTDGQLQDERSACSRTAALEGSLAEVNSYGFGQDFALESMKRVMGRSRGGAVKHIRDTNDIVETFQRIVQTSSSILAADARLELCWAQDVIAGDVFSHRPAPKLWPRVELAGFRARAIDVGAIESDRDYVWAFDARLPEGVASGFHMGHVGLTYEHAGHRHTQRLQLSVQIEAGPASAEGDPVVARVFQSLEDLRDRSPAVQIAAYEARIQIAREEGRDPRYIASLEAMRDHLRGGGRKEDMDDEVRRAADVEPQTIVPTSNLPGTRLE
jgi:hypothetical protein